MAPITVRTMHYDLLLRILIEPLTLLAAQAGIVKPAARKAALVAAAPAPRAANWQDLWDE